MKKLILSEKIFGLYIIFLLLINFFDIIRGTKAFDPLFLSFLVISLIMAWGIFGRKKWAWLLSALFFLFLFVANSAWTKSISGWVIFQAAHLIIIPFSIIRFIYYDKTFHYEKALASLIGIATTWTFVAGYIGIWIRSGIYPLELNTSFIFILAYWIAVILCHRKN